MELPVKSNQSEVFTKTTWLLISIALSAFEMLLPRIPVLPWLKPGLGNIITILWIIKFGAKDALLYSFLRSWITSFYFGFSFTSFALSLGGGIFSTAIMGILWQILGKPKIIGMMGLGMLGAFAHNIGQLSIIYFLLAHNTFVFYQIPFMCGASLVFGSLVGTFAFIFRKSLLRSATSTDVQIVQKRIKSLQISLYSCIPAIIVFMICVSLIFIDSIILLSGILLVITIIVQFIKGFSIKNILFPLRFWMLFLFIGIIYLFFSYGIKIGNLPFITCEGVHETAIQFCRLWIWIESGILLSYFNFHVFLFHTLRIIFPSHSSTLSAGLVTMDLFPEIIQLTKNKDVMVKFNFFRKPFSSFWILFEHFLTHIERIVVNYFLSKHEGEEMFIESKIKTL